MQTAIKFFLAISLVGCTTPGSIEKRFKEISESDSYKSEKKIFEEKLGGKNICWRDSVQLFTKEARSTSSSCIYPSSRLRKFRGSSSYNIKRLQVLQARENGYLVQGRIDLCYPDGKCFESGVHPEAVFVYKGSNDNFIDGAFLDDTYVRYYEPAGTYAYESKIGTRTVNAFKEVPLERILGLLQDFRAYDPNFEKLAINEDWFTLNEQLKKKGLVD